MQATYIIQNLKLCFIVTIYHNILVLHSLLYQGYSIQIHEPMVIWFCCDFQLNYQVRSQI